MSQFGSPAVSESLSGMTVASVSVRTYPYSYRTIKGSVFYRIAFITVLTVVELSGQAAAPVAQPEPTTADAVSTPAELKPDPNDPGVIRAHKDLERIQLLVTQGALPAMRARKAQEDVQNAEDLSILQANLFGKDLTVEQADQMLFVAQRLAMRRQR
jgi:hypothetical protein